MRKIGNNWIYPLLLVGMIFFLANGCKKSSNSDGPITDIDGNVYHSVTIGTQTWMVENLKTTKYRNGDPIANVTDSAIWRYLTTGAYCNYFNSEDTANTYGRLYNWYSVNDLRNLAPTGWHVPTQAEWMTLITFLGGDTLAGDKMKEPGTTHWRFNDNNVSNESDFTALPGGFRGSLAEFVNIDLVSNFWTKTVNSDFDAWGVQLTGPDGIVRHSLQLKVSGFSIRCIKD